MNRIKIISKKSLVHLIIIVLFFCANFVLAQYDRFFNGNYPRVNFIQDQGAILIGEMDYELSPGWKQYTQSCDQNYWIRIGAECNRPDSKACCDQQKHDYGTVVAPTVSETTEFLVPADGDLIYVNEILLGNHDIRIGLSVTIHSSDGNTALARGVTLNYGGGVPLIKNKVKKGDKIVLKAQAHYGGVSGMRYFRPQGVKTQVYFLPDDPSTKSNITLIDRKQKCEGEYLEKLRKLLKNTNRLGVYILCVEGDDAEVDCRGNGDFEEGEEFMYLEENAKVITGENTKVVIDFGKRGLVTVKPMTNFSVGRYIVADEGITANTSLKVGEVDVKIDRRYKEIDFEVSTGTCTASNRGTEFTISHEEFPIKSTVTVYSGEVEIQPTICLIPPMILYAGQSITVDNNCFGKLEMIDTDFSNAIGKPCESDKEFVRSLYQSVLERDLEVSFATGYGGAHMSSLQDGNSRLVTIRAFFNSPEYLNKQKNGQEFIRDAYQAVLGREPSTNESNQWPRIDRNEIIRQLFNSNEYRLLMSGCPEIGQQITGSLSMSGHWQISQNNGIYGTLTLQQNQIGQLTGTAQWTGNINGTISGTVTGNFVSFAISYPSGIIGNYTGTLTQNGLKISNGISTANNGATATWEASKINPNLSSMSGHWQISQNNGIRGTLDLQQNQVGLLTGTAQWSGNINGTISGTISGNSVSFTISYPSGIIGNYTGTLTQNGLKISNGISTANNGATATWEASR